MAGALRERGVGAGDRVVIYMPMIPEAIVGMLACARLGAVHSVVFGGFAPRELAIRIDDAQPKAVLTASCGLESAEKQVAYKPLLDRALEMADHAPDAVLIKQRDQLPCDLVTGRDDDWDAAEAAASPAACEPLESSAPLYILYTSGSTGRPKGVVRDAAGYCVALRWSMENVMQTRPGEAYWAASDVGWVVGHSYIVYAPLLGGCTTVLYEGKPVGTPDAGAFWRVAAEHKVKAMFTAPTALRAIRKEDPTHALGCAMPDLRALFVAGERCDPNTSQHFADALGVRVYDNWWQTETGWPICGLQDESLGTRPGSVSLPVPGYDVRVMGDDGTQQPVGQPGSLVVRAPLPPGTFCGLHNDEKRFLEYFDENPGFYTTGDAGVIDEDGYVTVLERTDDVINVAAHRLSSGQIEAVIKSHPGVNDCAVVGAADPVKGQVPLAFVVLAGASGDADGDAVLKEVGEMVRDQVGPIATLRKSVEVAALPKTRSGKVLRKNIRAMVDGVDMAVPGTIEDLATIDVVAEAIQSIGYPLPSAEQ